MALPDVANAGDSGHIADHNAIVAEVATHVVKGSLVYNVKDYGAVGNGTTDDTAAIQAAVTAASAVAGTVYFPAATYKLTATLTISTSGVHLLGAGMWNTILTRSTDYGNTINFTGNDATGVYVTDTGIAGFSIRSTGLTTSGAHINYNGVARHTLRDIYLLEGFIGIKAASLTAARIANVYGVFTNLFGGVSTGRRMMQFTSAAATYGHPSCGDVFVTDFNLRGNIGAGTVMGAAVEIKSADGIWFENGHLGNTTIANILLNAQVTETIGGVWFTNVMCDEGTGTGMTVQGAVATMSNVQFTNCLFKGNATATQGIVTDSTVGAYNFLFTNCAVTEYTTRGVYVASSNAKGWDFTGCSVRGNSYTSSGVYAGYEFVSCSLIGITGGYSGGSNIDPTVGAIQSYGVAVQAGCSNITLTGVNLRNNVSGGLLVVAGSRTAVRAINCVTSTSSTVASAATTTLPDAGTFFTISGVTTITSVAASWADREIVLMFSGVLTLTDGSNLKLAGNLVTTADDTITLISDGTNWIETARSVN